MARPATVRIGGASGFWGESDIALPQLLGMGGLDYIVFDYLAEVTMSIMARARAKDPALGYATDFVTAALKPSLREIAAQGVKIVSNAGGVNPKACGEAIRKLVIDAGLDLKVAVVTGDDLMDRIGDFAAAGRTEMFSDAAFPDPATIASANAYLGAFPIAEALSRGADIVVTGRCVDSAVTLGACIHAFGWTRDDLDCLSGASLAGHILECGPQATGGNFTDWDEATLDMAEIGYPVAEIGDDGGFTVTKPHGTGGQVTVATVGEQMLYEIGDPRSYILPDVICDFTDVRIAQDGPDVVRVSGAKGRTAPASYKASLTYADGFRVSTLWFFIGENASAKAKRFAEAALARARNKLRAMNAPDFTEVLIENFGDDSHYGTHARHSASREVTLKLAARHPDARACGLLLKEATGLALSAPPGLTLAVGSRPTPSPVVRLFSMTVPKDSIEISIDLGSERIELPPQSGNGPDTPPELAKPVEVSIEGGMTTLPLAKLAFARSGDKGDKSNIGVLPRHPDFIPFLWAGLTEDVVADRFAHFLRGHVERFFMPGTGAINFLLDRALGGGGMASLRNDPLGKSFGQILLDVQVPIPAELARKHGLDLP